MKILVVDDSLFARRKLVQFLQGLGYETQEAADGEQGVAVAQSWQPDLIFMDITMPVLDGIRAVAALRQAGVRSKVVMLSAVAQKSAVLEALKAGATDYLLKPYEEEKIRTTLHKHLGA